MEGKTRKPSPQMKLASAAVDHRQAAAEPLDCISGCSSALPGGQWEEKGRLNFLSASYPLQLAQQWLDPELAAASEAALSRVRSVLPAAVRETTRSLHVVVAQSGLSDAVLGHMQFLRQASQSRHKVRVSYRDAAEIRSAHVLRPLA